MPLTPITVSAMFQSVGIVSGFFLPIAVLFLFAVLVIPGLSRAGTKPETLAMAAYGYLAESLGIILMTAGGLPAVHAVVSHQILTSNTYLGLLLLFIIGGITYLWHDSMLQKVDSISKAIPAALFFYSWKFIGLLVALFASLSFILELLVGASGQTYGWWNVHLVMLLYGLLLCWFTVKPHTPAAVARPTPVLKPRTVIASKAKKPAAKKAK
ncbi:hypothetical protein K8942_04280 [Candidatus Peribacteria bacterium]|nr:MAG: hypothetical protein K8942_04280 [Candidatus Peribacteria bacterium]